MKTLMPWTIAGTLVMTASVSVGWLTRTADAQPRGEATWRGRTPWGDPDLQGEWTSEGEYGVPFERPAQFGTRQFLTDEEYAKRLAGRAGPRRARPGAGRCALRQGGWAERADSALARIQHELAAHFARDRSARWASASANSAGQRRFPCSGAAACSAASRATRTRTTASACAASSTAAAFRTRCSRRSTTRICASSRAPGFVAITLRADSRHARHSDRSRRRKRGARAVAGDPDVHGRRARPLGRDDAGRRDHQPQGEHARVFAGTAADRAVHAHRARTASSTRSRSSIRPRGPRRGPPRST